MKSDFSSKLDSILSAIENAKKGVNECAQRVGEPEVLISAAEDSITSPSVQTLENNNKDLQENVLDMEARSRRSNLRLVDLRVRLPGKLAAGGPELGAVTHTGESTSNTAAPRTIIMKFSNCKDKTTVTRAAWAKGQILFMNHPVRFYEDLATGVHKK